MFELARLQRSRAPAALRRRRPSADPGRARRGTSVDRQPTRIPTFVVSRPDSSSVPVGRRAAHKRAVDAFGGGGAAWGGRVTPYCEIRANSSAWLVRLTPDRDRFRPGHAGETARKAQKLRDKPAGVQPIWCVFVHARAACRQIPQSVTAVAAHGAAPTPCVQGWITAIAEECRAWLRSESVIPPMHLRIVSIVLVCSPKPGSARKHGTSRARLTALFWAMFRWGGQSVVGRAAASRELLKFGFHVSERSVVRLMPRRRRPPSQTRVGLDSPATREASHGRLSGCPASAHLGHTLQRARMRQHAEAASQIANFRPKAEPLAP